MSLKANSSDTIATEGGINVEATSFTLTTGAFDTKTSGDKVPLVIDYDNSAKLEVVTAYIDGTAVTSMVRAQDGTAAAAHSQGANICIGSVPSVWDYYIKNDSSIKSIDDAWTSFTPTWTGSVTNPAIGNGTLTGAYIQIGKTVIYKGKMTAGPTTTFGSGDYRMSLPVTAKENLGIGSAYFLDTGTAQYSAGCRIAATTYIVFPYHAGSYVARSTNPFTWASDDMIEWTITYEAAS